MSLILIIDDNDGIAIALNVLFSLFEIKTMHADTPEKGLLLLQANNVDLLIQDMNFSEDTTSGEEGRKLFQQIHQQHPDLPIILLTAWGTIESAVDLVKAGASDYLTKPWDDNKLITTVRNLLELGELRQQTKLLLSYCSKQTKVLQQKYNLCGTVFNSQEMLQTLTMATQVAHSDIPVLITGPNGSGKEKVAETIQANSSVKEEPYVCVNVAALPIDLLEAELFGVEAGAYTGAYKKRIGRFEAANGGTLFLDEIGNLPLSGQIKLLRVLQTGEFERLGSSQTIKVNVRVISATNTDLQAAIERGEFRQDLYYRLNVIEINVAPLASRTDDILPLAIHFMPDGFSLTSDTEQRLKNHTWPGNVRELENVIRRASLLAKNNIIDVLDLGLSQIEQKPNQLAQNNEPDRRGLLKSLEFNKFNISQTAKQLGLSRQSLYRRMDKFEIPKDK